MPVFAGIVFASLPAATLAQGTTPKVDCEKVTVYGSVSTNTPSGEIDWLALANQAELGPVDHDVTEGCLVDTEGVGVDEIIVSTEEGAAIADMVKGDVQVHQRGANFSGGRNPDSQLIYNDSDDDHEEESISLQDLPIFVLILFSLFPISLLLVVMRYVLSSMGYGKKQDTRRFTCRIPAQIMVSGQSISGRVMRFGPATCHFVPNSESDANMIAGLLMKAEVPDFDLEVGELSLPIVPDTPGSRFTLTFFVQRLSGRELESLKGFSLTDVRIERHSQPPKKSAHRENLRISRLRRIQAMAAAS